MEQPLQQWRLAISQKVEHRFTIISAQSLGHVWLFATPRTAARQASLSITNSRSLLKLMSTESVMPSNHLILRPVLHLLSIFPSIRVFSSESVLPIRWPKYWSCSFSISPSNESNVKLLSRVRLFATPRTVAYHVPSSTGFSTRVLEWVAISFSRGSSQPRNWTWASRIAGRHIITWATREANESKRFTIWFSNSITWYISKRSENTNIWIFIAAYWLKNEKNFHVYQLVNGQKILWYIQTMQHYLARRQKKVLIHLTMWVNLKAII